MKNVATGKPLGTDLEKLAALPDADIDVGDTPYDPHDPAAVDAFWREAKLTLPRRPGQRGPQRAPTKVPTTLRLDPEVLAAFKATGRGWQTRINDALKEWIATHR